MTKSIWAKAVITATSLLCANSGADAQTSITGQKKLNTITTAVPFMRISPDARGGSMGDLGLATTPDVNDAYWNVGKLAHTKKKTGASITYTPWLRDLVPDINLAYLSAYTKFGTNDNQAVNLSLRYFNLGTIALTNIDAVSLGNGYPREYAISGGYTRKLSEQMGVGINLKYIHSNLSAGPAASQGTVTKPGNAFASDIGWYYTKPMKSDDEDGDRLSLGASITNLGSRISYNDSRKDFLPTNLGVGGNYKYKLDEFNTISLGVDMNKLLVPSPYFVKDSVTGQEQQKYRLEQSVGTSLFSSFGDAPGGGSEEFKEIMWSAGAEYGYQNQFFARAGYFFEDYTKGNRKYATVGLGFKYTSFTLNLAYLVPSGSGINRNPLSNTLRFSLIWDLDGQTKKAKDDKDDEDSE